MTCSSLTQALTWCSMTGTGGIFTWLLQAPRRKTAENIKEIVQVLLPRLWNHWEHGYQHQDPCSEDHDVGVRLPEGGRAGRDSCQTCSRGSALGGSSENTGTGVSSPWGAGGTALKHTRPPAAEDQLDQAASGGPHSGTTRIPGRASTRLGKPQAQTLPTRYKQPLAGSTNCF